MTTAHGVGCAAIAATASFAGGDTIRVPADHPTIQAAINAASNGDVVLVADGTYSCRCDWDHTGQLSSQDFFAFLAAFFGGSADMTGDGVTNSQDFFEFLACFFAGCASCADERRDEARETIGCHAGIKDGVAVFPIGHYSSGANPRRSVFSQLARGSTNCRK